MRLFRSLLLGHRVTRRRVASRWSTGLVTVLGAVMALGQPTLAVSAEPDPWAAYGEHIAQAEATVEAGETLAAIDCYATAYDTLPPQARAGAFGRDVIDRVLPLAEAPGVDEPDVLRKTLALLDRHLEDAKNAADPTDSSPYEDRRAELAHRLERLDPPASAVPVPPTPVAGGPAEATPFPSSEVDAPSTDSDRPASTQRRAGIGLLSAGGIVLASGIGLLGHGGYLVNRIRSRYAANYEACARNRNCDEWDAWRADNTPTGNAVLASGAALAGVGAAMLVGGAILLARSKKTRDAALGPQFSTGPGFTLVGWF